MTLPEVNGFYWNCPCWTQKVNLQGLSKKISPEFSSLRWRGKASILASLSWLTVLSLCLAELSFFMELEPGIWKCPQCQECTSYFLLKSTSLANILRVLRSTCTPSTCQLGLWCLSVSAFAKHAPLHRSLRVPKTTHVGFPTHLSLPQSKFD